MFQRKQLGLAVLKAVGSGLAAAVIATPVMAQQPTQKIDKIEVTGSNIKRIEGESSVPITVITREQIEASGAVNTEDILKRISASTSMFSDSTQGAGYGTSNANLRGLGPTSTLVLLNGRRIANHAFGSVGSSQATVDLNAIPFAAIERVEVLRDGASAIYGADAVGGVINFITRTDYRGGELTFRYGDTEDRIGGSERGGNVSFGMGNLATDRYNLLVTFGAQNNQRLQAVKQKLYERGEREIANPFPLTSYRGFPGRLMEFGISPGAYDGSCNPETTSIQAALVPTPSGTPALRCRGRYPAYLDNLPDQRKHDLFGRFAFNLSPDHQLYLEGSYARNHSIGRIAPSPVSSDLTRVDPATGEHTPVLFPTSSRYYPRELLRRLGLNPDATGTPGFADIAWRSEPGGNRMNDIESQQARIVAGIKGSFSGWDYDTAVTYAQSRGKLKYAGYFHEARLLAAFRAGLINPFGPLDETSLQALRATEMKGEMRNSKGSTLTWDAKASRELMEMAGGPLAMAAGINLRSEKVDDKPVNSDYANGFHIGGEGTVPATNASRNVTALFAEASIPFAKGWELRLAARGDRYSDFGSAVSPQASIRWQPTKTFLIRSSIGKGFRAPTLWDSKAPASDTNTPDNVQDPRCPVTTEDPRCFTQYTVRNFSNPDLKAEKSKQATLGMVIEPSKELSFGLDYWYVSKTDTIDTVNGQSILTNEALYERLGSSRVVRDARGFINYIKQPLENLGGIRTSGFDLDATGRFSLGGAGKLALNLAGTYVLKYEQQTGKDSPYESWLGQGGARVPNANAYPRWQHTLTLDWERGPFGATFEQRFVLGWRELIVNNTNCAVLGKCVDTRRIGDYNTFNVSGRYQAMKNLTLKLGIRNLFDREPPYVDSATSGSHAAGYANTVADPRGRFWYGSVNYKFM